MKLSKEITNLKTDFTKLTKLKFNVLLRNLKMFKSAEY